MATHLQRTTRRATADDCRPTTSPTVHIAGGDLVGTVACGEGDRTWYCTGQVDGEPEARLATDDHLVFAVPAQRGDIYRSPDAGDPWPVCDQGHR